MRGVVTKSLVAPFSLKWGGLYEVDKQWNSSNGGHKAHRNGQHIDLSTFIVFDQNPTGNKLIAQRSLLNAIMFNTLGYPFLASRENPSIPNSLINNHWHVDLEEVSDE